MLITLDFHTRKNTMSIPTHHTLQISIPETETSSVDKFPNKPTPPPKPKNSPFRLKKRASQKVHASPEKAQMLKQLELDPDLRISLENESEEENNTSPIPCIPSPPKTPEKTCESLTAKDLDDVETSSMVNLEAIMSRSCRRRKDKHNSSGITSASATSINSNSSIKFKSKLLNCGLRNSEQEEVSATELLLNVTEII